MSDSDEFERMVARNADDIRDTILRNLRRRTMAKIAGLLAVIALAVVILGFARGWTTAVAGLAIAVLVGVPYAMWSWKRDHPSAP